MRNRELMEALNSRGLDAFWCTDPANRRYLSGFTGSAGALLIHASGNRLFTDSRYTVQAKREAQGFDIVECAGGETAALLAAACKDARVQRLGFEEDHVPVGEHSRMRELLGGDIELIWAGDILGTMRSVKTLCEIEQIREAAAAADEAFEKICGFVKPGMRERDVALRIDCLLRERCGATAFETIAASGPNSALPHAKPGERRLLPGDALVLDFGAACGGYCSDMTRTIFISTIDNTLKTVYNVVRNAQEAALAGIRAGIKCRDADALARSVIEAGGYGQSFGHGRAFLPHRTAFSKRAWLSPWSRASTSKGREACASRTCASCERTASKTSRTRRRTSSSSINGTEVAYDFGRRVQEGHHRRD
jgi:Xaa-Pro aminopeptidase